MNEFQKYAQTIKLAKVTAQTSEDDKTGKPAKKFLFSNNTGLKVKDEATSSPEKPRENY